MSGPVIVNSDPVWENGIPRLTNVTVNGHPVVVIDPESDEDCERMWKAFVAAWYAAGGQVFPPLPHGDNPTRAALRQFANPTPPKPDEPTGLGAVVEGTSYTDDLRLFVRTGGGTWDHNGCAHDWSEIDVERIVSEGVTP